MPDADADILRAAVEGLAAPRRKRFTAERHGLSVDDVMSLPHSQRLGLAFVELVNHLPADSLPQHGGLAATVAVTVPVTLGAEGASSVLEWELADEERTALRTSADVVRAAVASIDDRDHKVAAGRPFS